MCRCCEQRAGDAGTGLCKMVVASVIRLMTYVRTYVPLTFNLTLGNLYCFANCLKCVQSSELSCESNDIRDIHFAKSCTVTYSNLFCLLSVSYIGFHCLCVFVVYFQFLWQSEWQSFPTLSVCILVRPLTLLLGAGVWDQEA